MCSRNSSHNVYVRQKLFWKTLFINYLYSFLMHSKTFFPLNKEILLYKQCVMLHKINVYPLDNKCFLNLPLKMYIMCLYIPDWEG